MIMHFTESELSYILKQFGYQQLEGFQAVAFNSDACIQGLLEKEYISKYKQSYELATNVRLALSSWVQARYTLVRDGYATNDHAFAILASSSAIISYSRHEGNIQLIHADFSAALMDHVLADYLNVTPTGVIGACFNISFTGSEYLSYFGSETPTEQVSKATGLEAADIALIRRVSDVPDSIVFFLRDIQKDTNCLGVIAKFDEGYVMIKQILSGQDPENQKVVVVKGDSQNIVNSIYIV